MPSLAEAQSNFIATINNGPSALDDKLFSGDPERVMLGLRAHANTISHARLVALEETFPRTLEAMGSEAFNELSRSFCETAQARAANNDALGEDFADFLRSKNTSAEISDLASIEWQWLHSYHSTEATPLALADLAGLEESDLLALPASPHPSAMVHKLTAPLSSNLPELSEHSGSAAILITRPEADVILNPLNTYELTIFLAIEKNRDNNFAIGNLLELSAEQGDEEDALTPIITLINAGALAAKPSD